jgi:phospholipid-binding lipoprotein MlaA
MRYIVTLCVRALIVALTLWVLTGSTAEASDLNGSFERGIDRLRTVRPSVAYALGSESEVSAAGPDSVLDPWEPFNEKMFSFNRQFDRFILKPVATVWDFIMPNPVQRSIANALDNIDVVRRLTNNLLQLKLVGAGREVSRFVINSTIGVAGLFDVAKNQFGIEQSNEDTGQTFGVYGAGSGPYLVLPLLPVMTVRDGFGLVADTAMNPLIWILPFGATAGINGTEIINDRSLNLDTYERVEETVIDLYGAVRSAYLERRAAAIRE